MKPPEILSMVEEAAGTKMYEAKRSQCLKAIADNETKLNEIDRMLKDDIEPTMERLKGERAAYMEFQKVTILDVLLLLGKMSATTKGVPFANFPAFLVTCLR